MKPLPELRTDVAAVRQQREELRAERQAVARAAVDSETLQRRVDDLIAEAAKGAGELFGGLGAPEGQYSTTLFDQRADQNLFAAFAAIAPDRLRKSMLASVPIDGLSSRERAAKLAALDMEIDRIELTEELTLREIDGQTGGLEYRHRDARPDVLLAPTVELEEAAREPKAIGGLRKAS